MFWTGNGGIEMEFFDFDHRKPIIETRLMEKYLLEWQAYMNGGTKTGTLIPAYVIESWDRSRKYGVDEKSDPSENIISVRELENDEVTRNQIGLNTRLNECIDDLVVQLNDLNMHVNFNSKLTDGRMISTRNYSHPFIEKSTYVYDASEKEIGTTSLSLAAETGRTVCLVGPMHFKKVLHNVFTCSKPLLDGEGVVGVLTISAKNFRLYREAHAFLNSIHKILETEYRDYMIEKMRFTSTRKSDPTDTIYKFEDIIGETDKIRAAKKFAMKIAENDLPVLILGESGTGKELFAQSIHNASSRANKPFIAINCGAISKELVESELFGYEPGAFTGALKGGKIGMLAAANGGTVFLDEIDSMPLDAQVKLLRAISTGQITKIGGVNPISIDIRIISATKADLLEKADAGAFREDLYYRIASFTISIAPLRERREDIPLIVRSLVVKYAKEYQKHPVTVSDEYMESLMYYYWRGNIRELQSVVYTSMALLGSGTRLIPELLPERILKSYDFKKNETAYQSIHDAKVSDFSLRHEMEIFEEMIIRNTLMDENGSVTKAARKLGISVKSLYRKLEKYPKLKEIGKE